MKYTPFLFTGTPLFTGAILIESTINIYVTKYILVTLSEKEKINKQVDIIKRFVVNFLSLNGHVHCSFQSYVITTLSVLIANASDFFLFFSN